MTPAPESAWNPRYEVYARAHGRSPEAMRKHDHAVWPGGPAVGFMLWMSDQWGVFHAEHHASPTGRLRGGYTRCIACGCAAGDGTFDAWLQQKCPVIAADPE